METLPGSISTAAVMGDNVEEEDTLTKAAPLNPSLVHPSK